MHSLVALELKAGNKEELIAGKRCAFADISLKFLRIESLGMVRDTNEMIALSDEGLPQLAQCEFSVGECAMNVNSPFEHASHVVGRNSSLALPASAARRIRPNRRSQEAGRAG